jgi:hypothetical protein
MAENNGKAWTTQDDERLREFVASGLALPEIAKRLDRTESGAKTRAYILRLPLGRFGARRPGLSRWG